MTGTAAAGAHFSLDTEALFHRYHEAWESGDPKRIADLHSEDSTFWLQDGSARVSGRETLEKHYAGLFAQFGRFGWDIKRTLFGDRHWVFDYDMLIDMTDTKGEPFTARVGMVDVVEVNDAGEVTRKDVFLNREDRDAAFERAGLPKG